MRGTRHQYIGIVILIIAAIISIIALVGFLMKPKNNNIVESQISISGELVCLPHKNTSGGPTTLECTYGLKADDGRYYSLINYNAIDYKVSDQLNVTGNLKAEQSTIYDISGVIEVEQITKN